jgi:hypothetical protein
MQSENARAALIDFISVQSVYTMYNGNGVT